MIVAFSRDFAGTGNAVSTIITLGVPKTEFFWNQHLGEFIGLSLFIGSDLAHHLQKKKCTQQKDMQLASFYMEHFQKCSDGQAPHLQIFTLELFF